MDRKYLSFYLEEIVVLFLFIVIFGLELTRYPQSPDAAEMLMTARHGGVIHPPGYVLQGWINRFFILFSTSGLALSISSFLFHISSAVFFKKILNFWKLDRLYSTCLLLLFLLSPHLLHFSLQPSKYTTTVFFQIFIIWFSIVQEKTEKNKTLLSFLWAIALTQHLITVVLFPVVAGYIYTKDIKGLIKNLFVFVTTFSFITLTLLLQVGGNNAFPDWGMLEGLSDMFHLLKRTDIKQFNELIMFSFLDGSTSINAFIQNFIEWIKDLNILFLFIIYGLIHIIRNQDWKNIYWIISFAGILLFLMMNNHPDMIYWKTQNYRWGSLGVVYLLLLAAKSKYYWFKDDKLSKGSLVIITLFIIGNNLILQGDKIFVKNNTMISLFQQAVGLDLEYEHFYLSNSDEQIFYGARKNYSMRFPITSLKADWYKNKKLAHVENRLMETGIKFESLEELVFKLYHKDKLVASTDGNLIVKRGGKWIKRGLLFITGKNLVESPQDRLKSSKRLCEFLFKRELHLSEDGHFYSQYLMNMFSQSFMIDARYFEIEKKQDIAATLKQVSMVLNNNILSTESLKLCQKL